MQLLYTPSVTLMHATL